jgi:nucleotidyltransferase substrate binding protein (TIGR01987 family)
MNDKDIRWEQRFSSFRKALSQLKKFIDKGKLSELEEQGLIKAFEYSYELAWNVIKDYYEFQGVSDIQGSRDAIRMAFRRGLIEDGESWMNMIESRIQTSHTYNEETAREISEAIVNTYFNLFVRLEEKMEGLLSG